MQYVSIDQVKNYLSGQKTDFSEVSVKQYLHQLKAEKRIFDAGRGWYSSISNAFELHTQPVAKLVDLIKTGFPLLEFSCWSTAQINAFTHHLLAHFVTFIYIERDYMSNVYEFLKDQNRIVYLNPTQLEIVKTFTPVGSPIVIRPAISREPRENFFAAVEKIIADLYFENKNLQLMQDTEVEYIVKEITGRFRINMARLLQYSARRKIEKQLRELIYIPKPL